MIDAILPAGGRIQREYAAAAGEEIKALIKLGGKTILERTVDALRGTGQVARIVTIGPEEIGIRGASAGADMLLPEGNSGPENILRGLNWLHRTDGKHANRVLVITTDLPFLTSGAILGFLEACPPDKEICVPAIRREELEARFPGRGQPYVPLRDGRWTIGCAFLVNPEAMARNQRHIEEVFARRKSVLAMASMLGLGLIVRFLTWRLRIPDIERRCEELLGCSCAAVRGCAPELAFDVDTLEEYRIAHEFWERQSIITNDRMDR